MSYTFSEDDQRRGSQRGVQVRQERMARRALASETAYRLVTELDDVAPAALEAALRGMQRGTDAMDDVPIESTLDVKRLMESAELAHRIYRLASGQSTANVAHATTDDERRARLAELRARMTQHEDGAPAPGD